MLRIVVDERERPSGVPDGLRSLGATVDFRLLDVADYIVGDYAVERKSARDFVSSLFSGRLFDQAYRLGESYQESILIIEGSIDEQVKKMKNPRSLWGALLSAVLDFHLKCLFTGDAQQTAELIYTLAKGGRFGGKQAGPPVVVRKPKAENMPEVQRSIVRSLPGVGPRMAEQMLGVFGSVRKVFGASVTEMAVGAGIGRAKALSINKVLDATYQGGGKAPSQARLR